MRITTQPATTGMIATIHTLKKHAGLTDEDSYRGLLNREAGVSSSKELSVAQAVRVIEKMRDLAGGDVAARGTVTGLDGAIGAKLRALWISGYNLGIVRDRSDKAMLSYLRRQTGVSHVRFLREPRAGSSAIEGLKSWLARDGGVQWPVDRDDVVASKRAVLDAQWRRLIDIGAVKPIGGAVDPMEDLQHYAGRIVRQNQWGTFQSRDYDAVQQALGRKLRGALHQRGAQA